MIRQNNSKSVLGLLGWRHCKNALPKTLIEAVKQDLSNLMEDHSGSKHLTIFNSIDRQAKKFKAEVSGLQSYLQKNLHRMPAVYELALSQEINKILQSNIGWQESELSPIHNIRVKFPRKYGISSFTTVPWHQDYGATDPSQEDLEIVTAWIPLTFTSSHHGGIEIIPRTTNFGWLEHIRGNRGPQIKEEVLEKILKENYDLKPVRVKTKPGDVILIDQYTIHRSLVNTSRQIRWSIDMRYVAKGSMSGRPGMWSHNPIVGNFKHGDVIPLIKERQTSLDDSEVTIKKRVDTN
tara:strand:+ start:592 stop:1470 length:879 start_codon:yes stop_codon:yes gene_type:complete